MNQKVKIIFEGREEVLDTINSGGSIVELLGLPVEDKCALIGAEIKLVKKLGQGLQGEAFLIDFPGKGEKMYVVKKSDLTLSVITGFKDTVIEELDDEDLTWEDIEHWQPSEYKNEWGKGSGIVSVVIPPKLCRLNKPKKFLSIPSGDVYHRYITVPKGSYLCDNESFSEFCIAVYTGTLYRDSICINFFNTYSMFTCLDRKTNDFAEYKQFIFMDKIDGELNKYVSCIALDKYIKQGKRSEDIMNGIYIQTLFAIAAYQAKFKISHNDLHTKNVFVEFVTEKTEFNGKKLIDAEYYHYEINGKSIYFPSIPVIVKIGDYGKSVKYTEPIIGDKYVFDNGYEQHDGTGPWIPNIYFPQYDSLYFTTFYLIECGFLASKLGSLIPECVKYMCKGDFAQGWPNLHGYLFGQGYIRRGNSRPSLENLGKVKSSADVLENFIQPIHSKKPKGKIVTLGVI